MNYGGILQAFALQRVLNNLGHDAWIIKREYETARPSIYNYFRYLLRYSIKEILRYETYELSSKKVTSLRKNISQFESRHMGHQTNTIYSTSQLKSIAKSMQFDAYIVGSDQVWRPKYSPCISNYFLDFLEDPKAKRISYAASFGVNDWEYSASETEICKHLLKKFDAISVRETSGIQLCKEHFDTDATHVVDPTLLLDQDDYTQIALSEKFSKSNGNLFCHILDPNLKKEELISDIAKQTNLIPFSLLPLNPTRDNIKNHFNECVYPPVENWLKAFIDAKMVITDSFHGCVFSIIFNKPFWVIVNKDRGESRFISLLNDFNLTNRIIATSPNESLDFTRPIDWETVNLQKNILKQKSLKFLKDSLA